MSVQTLIGMFFRYLPELLYYRTTIPVRLSIH